MKAPIVFLPGMMCDARLFAPQISFLSSHHPVMVMPLTSADSIEGIAADILNNAPGRFSLLGLSMGGIVALEIMRQQAERVQRLALFDTNSKADLPERAHLRDNQIEKVTQGKLHEVMRDELKPAYLVESKRKLAILDLCMDMAHSLGPEVFVRQTIALRDRQDLSSHLSNINIPTLVSCGEFDQLCPIEKHQFIADRIPNAKLQIVPNAGHLPTLEQPDLCNAALDAWLG